MGAAIGLYAHTGSRGTGEYLVMKYPDRFSQKAVSAASARIEEAKHPQFNRLIDLAVSKPLTERC